MKKTSTFFVIHNFNTVPTELLEYCENYIIYDASIEDGIEEQLKEKNLSYIKIPNTGHNLSTYFRFFQEYYDELPDVMCLTKGHMVGRHCSKEFFSRVYQNKYFTYLYEDKAHSSKVDGVRFLTMENQYLEINNSWYVGSKSHPHRYFVELNDLLNFIYEQPLLPQYVTFSPGGCYIVLREQVLKHSKNFYQNMNKIMTYGLDPNFPVEAHMVERILPIIFEANYKENPWMNIESEFDKKLSEQMKKVIEYDNIQKKKSGKRIRRIIRKLKR